MARQVISQHITDFRPRPKGTAGDLVSDIDYKCQYLMIGVIRDVFPDHRIISEEGGVVVDGAPDWTWLIDPLDGTNNAALGIPLYGSCVTLCHDDVAVVAAIYVAHEDVSYSAVRGQGALRDGKPIRVRHEGAPELATLSWINGYGVSSDDVFASRARALLERRFKRTLILWSPSVDWSLLIRGRTGALLAYRNEPEDLLCGALIAAEAGATITDFGGNRVTDVRAADALAVAAPEVAPYVADVLAELVLDPVVGPLLGL